jgi:surface antigen
MYKQPANWYVPYASEMCTNHPSGVRQTKSPQHGDLMVFSWAPYGHVAVIDSVSGSTIHVVEQNYHNSGTYAYDASEASCFLTAQ